MTQALGYSLAVLGWRTPALLLAALVSAAGARRGHGLWSLALPCTAAILLQIAFLRIGVWSTVGLPEIYLPQIEQGWAVAMPLPLLAALLSPLLLIAARGQPRRRWTVLASLLGVAWPLVGISLRVGHASHPYASAVAAAIALACGAGMALRQPRPDTSPLQALVAYASFTTLVVAASVPDVFIRPFINTGLASPEQDCWLAQEHLRAGLNYALWAQLSTPIALLPVWIEARRLGQLRPAWIATGALGLSTFGLSPMGVALLTYQVVALGCYPL